MVIAGLLITASLVISCVRPWPGSENWVPPTYMPAANTAIPEGNHLFLPATRVPGDPILTPTPDAPHVLPTLRSDEELYIVEPNDTLGLIAQRFGVDLKVLIDLNNLKDPDHLEVGQQLTDSTTQTLREMVLILKLSLTSELVNSPASALFDIKDFLEKQGGYLNKYEEEIDNTTYTGAEIVTRVANEYSVNPRLLLSVLEYKSEWVSQLYPAKETLIYPMGIATEWRQGLYHQLAWAADNLNRGYYLWKVNAIPTWVMADGEVVPIAPEINAGTAGVQHLMSLDVWAFRLGPGRFRKRIVQNLFYPF